MITDIVPIKLPRDWKWKKLKHVARMAAGDAITSEDIRESGDYPVYGGNGLRGYADNFNRNGDFVLIGRQGALCGNINYASGEFWASEHAIVVDAQGNAEVRWLGELLTSMNLNQYSQSAAQPGIAVDVIANLSIPVPPQPTQRKIARFLDRETAEIDTLIVAKQRLLDLLAEKRRAIIAEAVMRGLDLAAPMRASGVDWLGDKLDDVTYTEEGMNLGVREKELPEVFATQEYQVLLVAEKYQTGFDQPLLHTMYVDRRLAGIQAVQTLSRLNRIHPLKEDTFVLDFVNDPNEIRDAFKTYFEGAEIGEAVDPARMYEIKSELDSDGVYDAIDVESFSAVYFKPRQRQSPNDHQLMNAALDPGVSHFKELQKKNPDEAELWRSKMLAFCNLYAFLSQIIPYQDSDLERLYVFLRHFATKLPRRSGGASYQFDDEVRLEYYRLQKISEGSISLTDGQANRLDGPSEVGSGVLHEEAIPLSRLIDVVNDRFGTDFNQADQLFFDQIVEAAISDHALRQAAAVNPGDKFELVFRNLLETLFVERMDQNEEIFARFMNDKSFQRIVTGWLASEAYRKLRLSAIIF
jgi:Type I restriction modification DNA specificity domain